MNEINWRDLPGFEGKYQVSTTGDVRHLFSQREPRVLKPFMSGRYMRVNLEGNFYSVHILVLTNFIGPRPRGLEAAHLDGNRLNNSLDNLAWVTHAENEAHKKIHGTVCTDGKYRLPKGTAHHLAKLDPDKAQQIREMYATGLYTQRALAERFSVHNRQIGRIIHGQTWKVAALDTGGEGNG